MKLNIKNMSIIVFYGALWGILEASLGYVLHFIPALIAGSIMFPLAGMILYKVYKKTDSAFALIYVGLVATSIKAINLFMPNIHIYKAINPMIAIMLEAVVVAIVIKPLLSSSKTKQITLIASVSFGWRILFWMWMGSQYIITGFVSPYVSDGAFVLSFTLIEGIIGAMILYGLYELENKISHAIQFDKKPIIAASMLIISIVTTILL
jgi:hypothetical protein